jgi:hypothetical protein
MVDAWDARHGLTFLLTAIEQPELDSDPDLDVVEVEALLAQVAGKELAA